MKTSKLKLSALLISISLVPSLSFAGAVEDTAITAAVKAKLLLEKDIPATNITVTTKDNEVSLKGIVSTTLQADKAIELAASINNVVDVDYAELKVQDSNSNVTDLLITAKVKGRIIQLFNNHKISDGYHLETETKNKEVHIFGTVAKSDDITTIKKEVKKIKDVRSIKTNIQVK